MGHMTHSDFYYGLNTAVTTVCICFLKECLGIWTEPDFESALFIIWSRKHSARVDQAQPSIWDDNKSCAIKSSFSGVDWGKEEGEKEKWANSVFFFSFPIFPIKYCVITGYWDDNFCQWAHTFWKQNAWATCLTFNLFTAMTSLPYLQLYLPISLLLPKGVA